MALLRPQHQDAVDIIAGWIVGGRFAADTVLPTEDMIGIQLGVVRASTA